MENEKDFEYNTFKQFYYPDPSSDDEITPNKRPIKRNRNIDAFFEKPKKSKIQKTSSTVGRAQGREGISYISTNEDDGATATHLIKIEVYDMEKLRDITPSEHWKHADVRVKYYSQSEDDKNFQSTSEVIYNITKAVAEKSNCKKYFFDNKK